MEDDLGPLNIEFIINNPVVKAAAEDVQASLQGVNQSAEQMAATVNAAFKSNVIPAATAEVAALNLQFRTGAINLQTYQTELEKLGVETKRVASQPVVNPAPIQQSIGLIANLEERLKLLKTQKVDIIDTSKLEIANAKIQALEVQLQQLHNVGRQGFDDLGNKIVETEAKTTPFGNALSRVTNLSNIGARAVTQLSRQIIGLGVGLLSFAIGAKAIEWIVDYVKNLDIFSGRLDQAKQNLLALNEVQKTANEDAGKQLVPLQLLYKAATDVTKSMESRVQAAKDLRAEYPEEFANSSNLAIVNGKLQKSYEDLSVSILKAAESSAAIAKAQQVAGQIIDIEQQKADAKANAQTALANAKLLPTTNKYNTNSDAISNPQADKISQINDGLTNQLGKLNQQEAVYKKTIDFLEGFATSTSKTSKTLSDANKLLGTNLQNFDNLLKNVSDKTDYDNIKTALQAKLDSLAPDDKQIAGIQDKIRKVEELEKRYSPKTTDGNKAAAAEKQTESQGLSLLASTKNLQEKIAELKDSYSRKALTKDEAEQQAVIDNFKKQAFAIQQLDVKYDAYVNKSKANAAFAKKSGIVRPDASQLDPIRDQAIADLTGKQELEKSKITIEQQKTLYDNYENYKLKYGEEKAQERYGNDVKLYGSYVEFLKAQTPAESDKSAFANGLRDLLKTEIPKAENAALQNQLNEQIQQFKHIDELTQTADAKQRALDIQFAKDHATLTANYTGQELAERLALLQKSYDKQLDDAKTVAFQTSQIGVDAATNTFNLSAAKIKELHKKLREELKADDAKDDTDPTKLTPAQRKQVEDVANSGVDQYGQTIDASNKTSLKFKEIAAYANAASSSFSELGAAVAPFNAGLGDTLSTLGEIAGVAGNAASSVASFASGDIVGGIQKGISAIAGVFKIFGEAKASAAKAEADLLAYNDGLLKNEIAYNELIRDRARTQEDITKLTLDELKARQEMLKTQTTSAQADYNTLLAKIQGSGQEVTGETTQKYGGFLGIGTKTKVVQQTAGLSSADYDTLEKLYTEGKLTDSTKTWFEALQKVHDEMGSITDAAKAAKDQMDQIATGTTANAIADAIVQGFKAGKKTAADFADDFQSLMQNAAISVFQSNFLNKKIAEFYDQFAAASEGGLTPDKIAALKASYAKIIGDAGKQYADLTKVVGDPALTAANTSAVIGISKSITETTGTQISGHLAGIQLSVAQLPAMGKTMQDGLIEMRSQTLLQIKIEKNTGRTADAVEAYLPYLKDIKSNQGDNLSTLLKAFGK